MPQRLVLIGHPVSHSLSPVFQQAALDHLSIPLRYEAIDVTDDAHFVSQLKQLTLRGAAGNVTLPLKARVAAQCRTLTPIAKRAGVVNTFWTDVDDGLHGDNTDVGGFLFAARRVLGGDLDGLRVVLLGAGGAASAVGEALRDVSRLKLTVHARRTQAGVELAQTFGEGASATDGSEQALVEALAAADLVVNATSLGIEGRDELPVAVGLVPANCSALDLTYRPTGFTPWVEELRKANRNADDGIAMLLEQGALAFERWFGVEAPRAVMARAIGR